MIYLSLFYVRKHSCQHVFSIFNTLIFLCILMKSNCQVEWNNDIIGIKMTSSYSVLGFWTFVKCSHKLKKMSKSSNTCFIALLCDPLCLKLEFFQQDTARQGFYIWSIEWHISLSEEQKFLKYDSTFKLYFKVLAHK